MGSLMLNSIHLQCFYVPPRIGSLPGVTRLRLVQAGFFSLSVGWDQPSSPVQGYRLTYGPRGLAHTHLYLCFYQSLI